MRKIFYCLIVCLLVTIAAQPSTFTFFLDNVGAQYPIFIPAYGVAVTDAGDKRSYQAIAESDDDVGGATPTIPGSPPITQTTFPACRAHYPGGPNRCLSVSSLFARPSPVNRRVGIHDFTFGACSSFTRVTACRVACPPKGGLCPEASTRSVTRPSRPVATTSYRQLHGWILLPLVICAVGAHR